MPRVTPLLVGVGVVLAAFAALAGSMSRVGGAVELEQADGNAKCDAKCAMHRQMVIARMKALRKQIDGDYHAMVHFGQKAGYVPPVRSIKAQVMDGTLLGGGKGSDPKAPPSFDPDVASITSGDSSAGKGLSSNSILPAVEPVSAVAKKMMKHADAKAQHASAVAKHMAAVRVHHRAAAKAKVAAAPAAATEDADTVADSNKPVVDIFSPNLGNSVKVHTSHNRGVHIGDVDDDSVSSSSSGGGSSSNSKGDAKWEKDFSFMKNRGSMGHAHHHRSLSSSERHVRTKATTEPAIVRDAVQKALSFATSGRPESKSEKAGDKLLGLDSKGHGGAAGSKDKKGPLDSKFLSSWFGDA